MAQEGFKRKLTAILSADVEGYSRLMGENEEATIRTLTTYRNAIAKLVRQYQGRIVDSPGDNILCEFPSAVDAVNCAVEIQREFAERNAGLPDNRKMEFRIGINVGDVVQDEERIYGDGVNIAARVESISQAGGICISGRAYDQVSNKLGLEYENLGEHQVKNISTPIRVYRVLSYPGAAAHRVVQAKAAVGKTWRNIVIAIAALLIVGVAAGTLWNFYFRLPPVAPASVEKMAYPLPAKPSIAVLPFVNMSGDSEQEYFSDGITDDIITDLSKISGLFVIARNSTFTYKGKPVKIKRVAEELGVRYVLEGSVRKADNRVRINAQLIDATTGGHLWAERYDGNLSDVFDLQDKITHKIVAALALKLTVGEQEQVARKYTDNVEAYEAFLKGRKHYFRFEPDDFTKAVSYFKTALELDPNFGWVYGWLALTYWRGAPFLDSRGHWYYDNRLLTIQLVEKAMIDPTIPAYRAATYLLLGKRLHNEAIVETERALTLDPLSPPIYLYDFGLAYFCMGDLEEAVTLVKRAVAVHAKYTRKTSYPVKKSEI